MDAILNFSAPLDMKAMDAVVSLAQVPGHPQVSADTARGGATPARAEEEQRAAWFSEITHGRMDGGTSKQRG